jgi:CRP-like cAMP-binding protein
MAASSGLELRKGDSLFQQRQRPWYMHFVVGGEIVLERTGEGGDPVVLQRVRQGFVAEASLQSGSYHCDAVVTSPGWAIAVPIEPIKAELATDSGFALRWIGMLNAEVRRLRAQCARMSLKGWVSGCCTWLRPRVHMAACQSIRNGSLWPLNWL